MFLNIQIDFIILKTDDEQFILTTRKKSLHITLKSFAVNKLLVATPVSSLETGYNLSAVVPGTDLGLAGSSFVLVVHLFWKMILGIWVTGILWARCPFCHPANSVKAVKERSRIDTS